MKPLITHDKPRDYVSKNETLVEKIVEALNFSKTYQRLGLSPTCWQNVENAFLAGVSHIDILDLSRHLDVKDLKIYADPMLEWAFYSLMQNVIDHGKIATEIRMSYQESDNGLILVFEDNGVGIPDSMKQEIFSRNIEERKGRGLFLTQEILEITNITIRETGTVGKGARFEMNVPTEAYRFADSKS